MQKGIAMKTPIQTLQESGCKVYYSNYSALDRFFRVPSATSVYLLTDSSLINLAAVFPELEYPGLVYEEALVRSGRRRYLLRCYDEEAVLPLRPFTVQELLYDPDRDVFLDPQGVYPDLRREQLVRRPGCSSLLYLAEAAVLCSRYHYQVDPEAFPLEPPFAEPDAGFQRELLRAVLSGGNPQRGMALLYRSGFVESYWPELQRMAGIPHDKDYHPEGNGWEHTLETFRYRKGCDTLLSLALLLHDVGKPVAGSTPERAFDGHAELGAEIAASFLGRLGVERGVIRDVCFLVRYHMMPAALKQLPLYRSQRIMDSPLFPQLLELYRADLSASYWSPEGYYEACNVYRTYRKNKANPYRRTDGRKQSWRTLN
jgi:poly(A) polymerase